MEKVKYRKHSWFDTKNKTELFGIQAKIEGRKGWMHLCIGKKPAIYVTRKERDDTMKDMRREERNRRQKFANSFEIVSL